MLHAAQHHGSGSLIERLNLPSLESTAGGTNLTNTTTTIALERSVGKTEFVLDAVISLVKSLSVLRQSCMLDGQIPRLRPKV